MHYESEMQRNERITGQTGEGASGEFSGTDALSRDENENGAAASAPRRSQRKRVMTEKISEYARESNMQQLTNGARRHIDPVSENGELLSHNGSHLMDQEYLEAPDEQDDDYSAHDSFADPRARTIHGQPGIPAPQLRSSDLLPPHTYYQPRHMTLPQPLPAKHKPLKRQAKATAKSKATVKKSLKTSHKALPQYPPLYAQSQAYPAEEPRLVADPQEPVEELEQDVVYPLEYNCFCGKADNLKMIQCDKCEAWYHYQCQKLTEDQVEKLGDAPFYCLRCEGKMKAEESRRLQLTANPAGYKSAAKPPLKEPKPEPRSYQKTAKPPLYTYRKDAKTGQLLKVKPAMHFPPPLMNKQQAAMRLPKTESKYKAKAASSFYSDTHLAQPPTHQSVDPLDMLLEEMNKEEDDQRMGSSSRILGHHKTNSGSQGELQVRKEAAQKTPKRRQEYGEWVRSQDIKETERVARPAESLPEPQDEEVEMGALKGGQDFIQEFPMKVRRGKEKSVKQAESASEEEKGPYNTSEYVRGDEDPSSWHISQNYFEPQAGHILTQTSKAKRRLDKMRLNRASVVHEAVEGQLKKIQHKSHRQSNLLFDAGSQQKKMLVVEVDEGDRSIKNNIGDYDVFNEFKEIQQAP